MINHRKSRQSLYLAFSAIGVVGFFVGTILHVTKNHGIIPKPTKRSESFSFKIEVPKPRHEKPLPSVSQAVVEFRSLGQEVLSQLTRKNQIDLNKDNHHAPTYLVDSAYELGRIEDAVAANPKLAEEAVKFYRGCALQEDLMTALRAVCVSNLKEHASRAGISQSLSLQGIPEGIQRVAQDL